MEGVHTLPTLQTATTDPEGLRDQDRSQIVQSALFFDCTKMHIAHNITTTRATEHGFKEPPSCNWPSFNKSLS